MYQESDFYTTERDARNARDLAENELEARMDACDAGLVSYRAACEGGARYERELREAGVATPAAAALAGWLNAVTVAYQQEAA